MFGQNETVRFWAAENVTVVNISTVCHETKFLCCFDACYLTWLICFCTLGADTPVYLALLPPDVTSPRGSFLSERKVVEV